jgi:hypothetical protein
MAAIFEVGSKDGGGKDGGGREGSRKGWSYEAIVPEVLRGTGLPLPGAPKRHAGLEGTGAGACGDRPRVDAGWWEAHMAGQEFAEEDRLDTARFNAVLWQGLRGDGAPPSRPARDLRRGRAALLAAYHRVLCRP